MIFYERLKTLLVLLHRPPGTPTVVALLVCVACLKTERWIVILWHTISDNHRCANSFVLPRSIGWKGTTNRIGQDNLGPLDPFNNVLCGPPTNLFIAQRWAHKQYSKDMVVNAARDTDKRIWNVRVHSNWEQKHFIKEPRPRRWIRPLETTSGRRKKRGVSIDVLWPNNGGEGGLVSNIL